MLKELQLHGHVLYNSDVSIACFDAVHRDFDRISLPPFFIPQIAETLKENVTIAALIDFPYGMSDTKIRQHATLDCIHKGATGIDLVINAHWLINDKKSMVQEDIATHKRICDENDISLKVMVDYRRLRLPQIKTAFSILWNCGVRDATVSTGHFMDSFIDQFAILNVLKTSYVNKIQFVMNGTVATEGHLKQLDKEGFGIRLHSGHAARILFPVKTISAV